VRHAPTAIQQTAFGQRRQHESAEAAPRAFLDSDEHLVVAGEISQQRFIQRLGETCVRHRRRETLLVQHLGREQAFLQARSVGQDGGSRALLDHASLADLQRLRIVQQLQANALAARITESRRAIVDRVRRSATMRCSSTSSAAAISTKPGSAPEESRHRPNRRASRHRRRRDPRDPSSAKRTGRRWMATSWTTPS